VIRPLGVLAEAGAKPVHLEHATRAWLAARSLVEHAEPDRRRLPAAARARLAEVEGKLSACARIVKGTDADDGARRLLVELEDGQRVESVVLPGDGLCVSTQVGCAVGCTFCATGTLGLTRNLAVEEILAQVVLARSASHVRRVVFMGMGEPAHNLENVLESIRQLGLYGDIGHKDLVFSTVGDADTFERLAAGQVKPALALSLHSTSRELRERLLPRAPRADPHELLEAALHYGEVSGHPLQLQWTLLAGVNDTEEELERLIAWLRGRRAVVDFIEYNPHESFEYERTPRARTHELTRALHAVGILAKLRSSAGQEAGGGCGQLVAGNRAE
jgi:23S rRNA (adenine2503-C2)-methyltransferase